MPRIRFRDFMKGVWMMGSRSTNPPGTLRRSVGTAAIKTAQAVSRWGSTLISPLVAHSITHYNDQRFLGVGDKFYRAPATLLFTGPGFNGARLTFVRMPPQPGDPDYLFAIGAGQPIKVSPLISTSLWGITAPASNFSATTTYGSSRTIDTMDSTASWVAANATLTTDVTIKQQGTGAMKMAVAASLIGTATETAAFNLAAFPDGTDSADQDMIVGWVRVDNPSNLVQLQIQFDVDTGSFSTDYYTRNIPVTDVPPATQFTTQTVGVGSPPSSAPTTVTVPAPVVEGTGGGEITYYTVSTILEGVASAVVSTALGAWILLRIPKQLFQRSGTSTHTWANVAAVRLGVQTNANGPVIAYWDDFKLLGATGMLGPYKYRVTFANSTTGSRSNPNPLPVTVDNVQRQPVVLTGFPLSNDPQVDRVEVWRTVGGGSDYFYDTALYYPAVSYIDRVSDFFGFNGALDTSSLASTLLPLDNAPPSITYSSAFGPLSGTIYFTRDTAPGNRGRVYYSPVGRPESVLGFVEATTDDDPTQGGCIWNGRAFVFTESKIIELIGTGGGIIPSDIFGAPGTVAAFSIIPTPYGIAYLGLDGPRIFNGAFSKLIAIEATEGLFRGEASEDIPPFFNSALCYAAFINDEYIISDTVTAWAVNLVTGTWRIQGLALRAIYAEAGTGHLLGSTDSGTFVVEAPQTFSDNGTSSYFEIQTPNAALDDVDATVLQRVIIDVNPARQFLTPTLLVHTVEHNGLVSIDEIPLPALTGNTRRTIEYAINRSVLQAGVRLIAWVDNAANNAAPLPLDPPQTQITVYGIELEVYTPAGTGKPTP